MSTSTLAVDTPVVEVRDLSVAYGQHQAVNGVSFAVPAGRVVAVVGESGSGKTTTVSALLGLLPAAGRVVAGSVHVGGRDLTHVSERERRAVRGRVVGYVPQDPTVGLNPTLRVGEQVAEAVRRRGVPRRSVPAEVLEALAAAGIDDPAQRARQHPHQLSGGLRQRVLIATALAAHPQLVIADEPTSALDTTVAQKILDHLEGLVRTSGTGLLIITHDLRVATDRADEVLVMSAGRIVERGRPVDVLGSPQHPYTQRLVADAPGGGSRSVTLVAPAAAVSAEAAEAAQADDVVLRLEGVTKDFVVPRGAAQRTLRALDDVSLSVRRGTTLALVGESGSGKTTALRVAMRLEEPTSGRVVFDGEDITRRGWRELRPLRRRFQLVHQNPFAALDPRWDVRDLVTEPLHSFGIGTSAERARAAERLLDAVHLPAAFADRRPAELSGGQRQRVAIARALALDPELVLLDEPVSALDVTVQAQVLDLLVELQRERGLSYLLISHDLAVVADTSHDVAVMSRGRIVESGPTAQVFADPQATTTAELLAAVPGQRAARRAGAPDGQLLAEAAR
ncbi:peptide/nickel transport system ATP-binding protein [Quadrisphaera granulorum]|uniref:Peptide/nickel transport system ATP-binding protein n=1 Tax=Quadrisphaera granulorum TaxID=317664 RepID=A0A315ZUB8_9ACTN|nr:ABC transporter ATP-binding protein [Quadrisphaera granulorum]PWJ48304.1 peptide/nickel transport system ATP-binding protein [Quadrisphaera granulorum]SZE98465.1 peptide/nickel transport system ATP-binding protein [Quadrisphaera granulorum]